MRFSVKCIIDGHTVGGLYQPVSLAVDGRGNLLVCDHDREGPPMLSRLVTADDYTRVVLATEATLGLPPLTVRVGPRDNMYVHGRVPGDVIPGVSHAVRLSGYGVREQVYHFPRGSVPSDILADDNGKLWAIFSEDSPIAMLHAYDLDGTLFYDYGEEVKAARLSSQNVPPAFADGQSIARAPDGTIWVGAYGPSPDEDEEGRELINCAVALAKDGTWRSWHYPNTFTDGGQLVDFLGLVAPRPTTLLTVAYSNPATLGERDEFLVEIDCAAQRVVWHNLADDVGLKDLKARLFPSIVDMAYRDGLLYLCDRNQSRIVVLTVED